MRLQFGWENDNSCCSTFLLRLLVLRGTEDFFFSWAFSRTTQEIRTLQASRTLYDHSFPASSEGGRGQRARFSESVCVAVLWQRRGYTGVSGLWSFPFAHVVSKEKVWANAFPMVPTGGVKPRPADVGVTFTANECNIWFFITTLPKSINRTQHKDQ